MSALASARAAGSGSYGGQVDSSDGAQSLVVERISSLLRRSEPINIYRAWGPKRARHDKKVNQA